MYVPSPAHVSLPQSWLYDMQDSALVAYCKTLGYLPEIFWDLSYLRFTYSAQMICPWLVPLDSILETSRCPTSCEAEFDQIMSPLILPLQNFVLEWRTLYPWVYKNHTWASSSLSLDISKRFSRSKSLCPEHKRHLAKPLLPLVADSRIPISVSFFLLNFLTISLFITCIESLENSSTFLQSSTLRLALSVE